MPESSAVTDTPVIDIDPFDESVLLQPEPFQEALREAGDFVWLSAYGVYATGRYNQVADILRDWQTYSSEGGVGLANFHKEKPWRPPSLVLEHDPPEHTRARAVLMRALTPVALRRLRDGFAREAKAHVSRLLEIGRFDAIRELAEGYPLKVFGDAVGITAHDRHYLLDYGNMSFNAMGPRNAICLESMKNQNSIVAWIMAQCARGALDPDGLGMIMYAAADEGAVTEEEAGMLVRSFLSAGVDTTVRAVGGALEAMARNPAQWQILHSDPTLARAAVEEAIRYASPFQTVFRTTAVPVEKEGLHIGAGEKIMLSIAAANHDPRKWDRPNEYDIRRKTIGHVGFGAGIHSCAGQMLARFEMEALFEEMARQISSIEIDGETAYAPNNTTRGLSRLPLRAHS
jgi:4-methoxybenzoate monooxygenase (O-demethylating)